MITSRSNSQLKNIRKLQESGKARKEQKVFLAEGGRILDSIPKGMLQTLYVAESRKRDPDVLKAAASAAHTETVADDLFGMLCDTVNPQGLLAVVKQPVYDPDMFFEQAGKQSTDRKLVVILDDIRDPGNLGTIFRTSEAAGVEAVILSPGCADVYNPKVVRSTMGSVFRLPFFTMDPACATQRLKAAGFEVYGAALDASVSYKIVSYGEKVAFVIGNEANGIRKEVLTQTTANLMIPMKGTIESLNAAVSLAVLLFHLT